MILDPAEEEGQRCHHPPHAIQQAHRCRPPPSVIAVLPPRARGFVSGIRRQILTRDPPPGIVIAVVVVDIGIIVVVTTGR